MFRRIGIWLTCTFFGHDIEIIRLELKDGIEPSPVLNALSVMLGPAICVRCGKSLD